MLIKRLAELSGINQDELESLLQIKRTSSSSIRRKVVLRPITISPCRWLIQILLHDPSYAAKMNRAILSEYNINSNEMDALLALLEFIEAHPFIGENTAIPSAIAYFHNSVYRELLEEAESATLSWDNKMNLEAEFKGALIRLQQMQRKQRMTELQNKPLNILTSEEKKELRQLAVLLG
tara:strand:- start:290 stop:826 length:537 start_codon:yes stop_codon:yes gene_type:complete